MLDASRWHVVSAPDTPPRFPVTLLALLTKNDMFPADNAVGDLPSLQRTANRPRTTKGDVSLADFVVRDGERIAVRLSRRSVPSALILSLRLEFRDDDPWTPAGPAW